MATYLDKYVSRHGEAVLFCCAQPPDQLLALSNAAVVQQDLDHAAVSRQELQSSNTVQ